MVGGKRAAVWANAAAPNRVALRSCIAMLRSPDEAAEPVRNLLQNLPPTGVIMPQPPGMLVAAVAGRRLIRFLPLLLAVTVATAVSAQAPRPPTTGPGPEPARRNLWQMLTPEQREQLWRGLSADQRADVWRNLEPQERREFRERQGAVDPGGDHRGFGPRADVEGVDLPRQMTPEERQKMRDQIREAHRQRRERIDQERRSRLQ